MSYKVEVFKALMPNPMTKRDITLWWPVMPTAAVLVQSLQFPIETMSTVTVPYRGVSYEMPVPVFQPGDWVFELPESHSANTFNEIERVYYDRRVMPVYLFLGNILNAFNFSGGIEGLGNVFSTLGATALATLRGGVVLEKAYIKNIAPVDFSMSQPDQPVIWRITMRYGYISPISSKIGL